ncbi:MAG: fimbrial biogenesis outer membrane usher protein [Leptolyngbya sp. UWPOB_LEPTO1]|uniref:fimbria/pilus outer membrane usher protein n=1 Tax=Leptolyngbya sp. UWPOB_LEPTO1 TaxID=2815653 RepID=UPI001ACDF6ED|nr:fimbria/pilus outer membrane usher protein [Leptolyngbya sp. UWPOB_LEPTO1]MBN8564725.1 fimbrial biogenesis outer membrane usher protein [Leptolyngbya sp. UWPOB_LEPTO1]
MLKSIYLRLPLALPLVFVLPAYSIDSPTYSEHYDRQTKTAIEQNGSPSQSSVLSHTSSLKHSSGDIRQFDSNRQPVGQALIKSQSNSNQAVAQSSLPDDSDAVFERVFGKPRNTQSRQIVVPLIIDQQRQGQILVLTNANTQQIRLQAKELLEKLADIIRPDLITRLQNQIEHNETLTLSALKNSELEAEFDTYKLELRIQVPAAARRTNVSQANPMPPEAANAVRPSRVSAYLNLLGGQDFAWSGNVVGRQPLQLNWEGALNVNGWVLEGGVDFREGQESAWMRRDVRLVRDDPSKALRYIAGDVAMPARGYQTNLPMLGVTIARNFSLQPYRQTRPLNQFEFFLERPSRVEVLINDRPTKILRLPAGQQDIRDLPLNAGINDVQLIITDDVGRVQRLSFPAAVAADLLAPGLQQFAYGLGFITHEQNGARTYDWNQPTLTASHRWGILNTLTFGGYLQANSARQIVGVEGIWASGMGNWAWNIAASHDAKLGADIAARLQYDFTRIGSDNPNQRTVRFALEYRGANFRQLERSLNIGSNPEPVLDFAAYYSQKLFSNINTTLGGRYQIGRGDTPDAYRIELGFSRAFSNGLNLNLNLSHQRDRNGQNEQRAYVSLLWLLPLRGQSLMATTNFSNRGAANRELTWNFDGGNLGNDWNGALALATNSGVQKATGRLTYNGYRANVGLSHDGWMAQDGSSTINHVSRLTFGTALVFADGQFGWSRPIDNSFALVVRQGNLKGRTIGINPTSIGHMARADALGAAVVPALTPYQVSTLRIDPLNIPLGFEIGRPHYALLPTYRSGTLIRVGTDATVFLRGVLSTDQGEPISLQSGEVVSLSDPKWQPITIFTNQVGRFALSGFKPGKYEIRLGNSFSPVQFDVPRDQSGIYDIGQMKLLRSRTPREIERAKVE